MPFARSMILFLAFCFSTIAGAAVQLPPQIKSISEKTAYLLFLQEQVPRMFEQGAEYDVDFLSYIDGQNQLVTQLQRDPTFLKLSAERSPLAEIKVWLKQTAGSSVTLELDQTLLDDDLAFAPKIDPKARPEVFQGYLDKSGSISLKGLLSGLLSVYSPELKEQGFRLRSNRSIFEFVKEHPLDQSVLDEKFKARKVGLKLDKPTWDELMTFVEEFVNAELAVARALVRASSLNTSTNHREMFGPDTLETERFEKVLTRWKATPAMRAQLSEIREAILKQYYRKSSVGRTEDREVLTLKEVPPYVGIFRGLAGSDCSTNFSFPYVYSPMERTYFIYSPEGHLLGYVMATIVKGTDGAGRGTAKNLLYVHTISGPELSPRHVSVIMHALNKAMGEIGVDAIVLPPKARIHANINYVPVQNALYEMLDRTSVYRLTYPDAELRQQFVTWQLGVGVDETYDGPAANPQGHAAVWNKAVLDELSISYKSIEAPRMTLTKSLTKEQAVLIALDLLTSERLNTARTQLQEQIAGIHEAGMAINAVNYGFRTQAAQMILQPFRLAFDHNMRWPLNDALNNLSGDHLSDYYNELDKLFSEHGVRMSDELLQGRPYLFYEGHLTAPDAFTTKDARQLKRSVDFLITMIKRWPRPDVAITVITNSADVLRKSTRFNNFIQGLFEGDAEDYLKLKRIRDAGYTFEDVDYERAMSAAKERLSDPALGSAEKQVMQKVLKKLDQDRASHTPCERLLAG